MKILNISTYEAFEQLYQRYEQAKGSDDELKSLLLFFVASDDLQTKESWCSDCRACRTTMEKAIDDFRYNEQLSLAIVQVGQRDDWKTADNPYRKHKLQITAVPTLMSLKLRKPLNSGPKTGGGRMCRLWESFAPVFKQHHPMIDYDLKDSQLFNYFANLLFMLVLTRFLIFFIVYFKVKRKV